MRPSKSTYKEVEEVAALTTAASVSIRYDSGMSIYVAVFFLVFDSKLFMNRLVKKEDKGLRSLAMFMQGGSNTNRMHFIFKNYLLKNKNIL